MFERYFQHIDGVLVSIVGLEDPLVLSGVEREVSGYRQVTALRTVQHEAVLGNPELISVKDLHERSWAIVSSVIDTRERELRDRFSAAVGTELQLVDPDAVAEAANAGRLQYLFITEPISEHPAAPARLGGVYAFVNDVIAATLQHKGEIVFVPDGFFADGTVVGALARW
jgi:hypothetical protein